MIDFFAGWLLILAGGLVGSDLLINLQPSLKNILHPLQAYRESLGLFNLILGGGSLFHALSTAGAHIYAPLYWLLYFSASLFATCVGLFLSIRFLNDYLLKGPQWLHRFSVHLSLWVDQQTSFFCWGALSLGLWRGLEPLFGSS